MHRILVILLLLLSPSAFAADYYFYTQSCTSGGGALTITNIKYSSITSLCTAAKGVCINAAENAHMNEAFASTNWGTASVGALVGACHLGNHSGANPPVVRFARCPNGEVFQELTKTCGQCPSGQEWNTQTNSCVESCTIPGQVYYPANNACGPVCQEPEKVNFLTVGAQKKAYCQEPLPDKESPKECDDIAGYVKDTNGVEHQICNDNKNACEDTGGTFGYVNDKEVCLPEDFPDNLPTCDDKGVVILTEQGFICESPEPPDDPENPEVPNSEKPDCTDTDSDGVCNVDDGDIDGDGIPNSEDDDDDGDGVDDDDDGEPQGPKEDESSVAGGGSCDSRPNCKGDAVDCASLYQLWSIRCESNKGKVSGECGSEPECEGGAVECATLKMDWRQKCATEEGATAAAENATFQGENGIGRLDKTGPDINGIASGVFSQTGPTGTCPPDETVTVLDRSFSFSYQTACNAATSVRPFVLLGAGLVGAAILHKAF